MHVHLFNSEGRRRVGRPKLQWIDGITNDLQKLGVKNWWIVVTDELGRKVLKKLRSELACGDDDDDTFN